MTLPLFCCFRRYGWYWLVIKMVTKQTSTVLEKPQCSLLEEVSCSFSENSHLIISETEYYVNSLLK